MTATTATINTTDALKAFAKSPAFVKAAADLLCAMAFSELERERVDAYIKPVFDRFTFTVAERFAKVPGERITKRGDLYLCDDESKCTEYFAACDASHREHGFTGEHNHCPALIADYEVTQAEWAMLKVASAEFGVDWESVNCRPEHRKKMLDLMLGLAAHEVGPNPVFKEARK